MKTLDLLKQFSDKLGYSDNKMLEIISDWIDLESGKPSLENYLLDKEKEQHIKTFDCTKCNSGVIWVTDPNCYGDNDCACCGYKTCTNCYGLGKV